MAMVEVRGLEFSLRNGDAVIIGPTYCLLIGLTSGSAPPMYHKDPIQCP